MEKDYGSIPKNPETEIIVRVDDFGGRPGLTIREFVKSERYQGFTKAGTRIPAEHFKMFKDIINSIKEEDFKSDGSAPAGSDKPKPTAKPAVKHPAKKDSLPTPEKIEKAVKKEIEEELSEDDEDFDEAM